LSITRPTAQPLTVQIETWPDNPDAPRRWTESAPQAKGATRHVVAHLRPNTVYKLRVNGEATVSLRADKAGRIEFAHTRGYAVPQKCELGLTTQ
jgi:hypothetical protein